MNNMQEKESVYVTLHKDIAARLKDEFIPDYNFFDVLSFWLEKKIKNENRESLLSALTTEEMKEIKFIAFDVPVPEGFFDYFTVDHSIDEILEIMDLIFKEILKIKPNKPGVLSQSEIDEILGSIAGDDTVYGKFKIKAKYISNGVAANNKFFGFHVKIRQIYYETLCNHAKGIDSTIADMLIEKLKEKIII